MRNLSKVIAVIAVVGATGCNDGTGPGGESLVADPAASLTTGNYFTCGLTSAGKGLCWGANHGARLGNGTYVDAIVPTVLAGAASYRMIDTGDPGSCALSFSGQALCWAHTPTDSVPTAISSPAVFTQISTSGRGGCGLTAAGAAYCWGLNQYGQLGNGTTTESAAATAVSGGITFAQLSVGLLHACGVATSGDAYCWGHNFYGGLGTGTVVNSTVPAQVTGGIKFRRVSAGGAYTCGVSTTGAGYCWGINASLQLGSAAGDARSPVPVLGNINFASINAGSGNNIYLPTCGISTAGEAWCWGNNDKGQLGASAPVSCSTVPGVPFECASVPQKVPGLSAVVAIDPSVQHTCAMLSDRRVYCFGDNSRGQLGDGTTTSSRAPILAKAF